MKLTGAAANGYFRKPDPTHAGLLIFGADPMRIATKRQEAIAALIGPHGEEEMRLTRINAADLRKDPAALDDAIKAQGFFPGHRVAFVEDATDGLATLLGSALADWRQGDAQLVVTAAALTAKSALRKVFETHRNAMAIGIYDDPPSPADIADALAKAGLAEPSRDVMQAMMGLANTLEPGDFRQTLDKLGLYKIGDPAPVSLADLAAVAPQSAEVDLDDVLDVVTDGKSGELGPALGALYAQGVTPVTLCIGAMRHFRRLHVVAADPQGAGAGIGRLRPPVFGPRRDKIQRQASRWGRLRLEQALTLLTDTDLQLRSASTAPQNALMERALIRLAMMAGR
jgi:DNA polymerase III subunit delta